MKFNKAVILPILAVISMIVQAMFGVDISEELQNEIAEVIINVISVSLLIYGIFKDYRKQTKQDQNETKQGEGI